MADYIDTKYIRLLSNRLRNFKQKKEDLFNFSCPICGDSKKNSHKARGYIYSKGGVLFYNCKNCGVGMSISNFIQNVDIFLYKEYIFEKYVKGKSQVRLPTPNIAPQKLDKVEKKKVFDHASWICDLSPDHVAVKYLDDREIPKEFYSKLMYTENFKIFCDALKPDHGKVLEEDARVIIPYYNEYNEIIAISGRALGVTPERGKYITIRLIDIPKLIFGLDRVDKSRLVKIVEGQFDSLFLDNCIASCDSALHNTAKIVNADDMVLIFDNENRNKDIINLMKKSIKAGYKVVIWPDNILEKDINDMILYGFTQEAIENIISVNTFSGLGAMNRLNFWKRI
jgi:transcription elongation factor Elf1